MDRKDNMTEAQRELSSAHVDDATATDQVTKTFDWCEQHGHPLHEQLVECRCGLIRYDE